MEKLLDAFRLPVAFGALALFALVRVKDAPFYKLTWAALILALALIGLLDYEGITMTWPIGVAILGPMLLFGGLSMVRKETLHGVAWRLLFDRCAVSLRAKRH